MKRVMVFKYDGTTETYQSAGEAARHYGVSTEYIKQYIKRGCGSYKHNFTKIFYID